jgi:hypothetical protein
MKVGVKRRVPCRRLLLDFRKKKNRDGLENIEFKGRYKISTSELFEYRAMRQGRKVRGAGDTQSEVSYEESESIKGMR